MKKYYILLFFIAVFRTIPIYAALPDSVINQKIKLADIALHKNEHTRAFSLYMECANEGDAKAINAVGVLKQHGWGTEKDERGSIEWFEKAYSLGYEKAGYNLVQVYICGLGTEVDFKKALSYLEPMANQGNVWANAKLGYFYYKGLGVEQSYENAIKYFLIGADGNDRNALYFLGLCYLNGYGVERDNVKAQYYLQKSENFGNTFSKKQLTEEAPENTVKPKRVKIQNTSTDEIPPVFKKIKRQKIDGKMDGEYAGKLITYDYSGKNILREVNLQLKIENISGNIVKGKWIEADSIGADFTAIKTDSSLQFMQTKYARTDYYNRKQAVSWIFDEAILEKTETSETSYLTGNIRLVSERTHEPERPMYVSLQKTKEKEKSIEKNESNIKSRFVAYPNPVEYALNISFELNKPEQVKICLLQATGAVYMVKDLGTLTAGKHIYTLDMDAPSGQYIFVLQKPSGNNTTLINRK